MAICSWGANAVEYRRPFLSTATDTVIASIDPSASMRSTLPVGAPTVALPKVRVVVRLAFQQIKSLRGAGHDVGAHSVSIAAPFAGLAGVGVAWWSSRPCCGRVRHHSCPPPSEQPSCRTRPRKAFPAEAGVILRPRGYCRQGIAGGGSVGGLRNGGTADRSIRSHGAVALASRRVSGGRFHFTSMSLSADVWSKGVEDT